MPPYNVEQIWYRLGRGSMSCCSSLHKCIKSLRPFAGGQTSDSTRGTPSSNREPPRSTPRSSPWCWHNNRRKAGVGMTATANSSHNANRRRAFQGRWGRARLIRRPSFLTFGRRRTRSRPQPPGAGLLCVWWTLLFSVNKIPFSYHMVFVQSVSVIIVLLYSEASNGLNIL